MFSFTLNYEKGFSDQKKLNFFFYNEIFLDIVEFISYLWNY